MTAKILDGKRIADLLLEGIGNSNALFWQSVG
jgi:hypothetical protein